jgi:hypothetical protein
MPRVLSTDTARPERSPLRRLVRLPWLDLEARFGDPIVGEEVARGLFKLADGQAATPTPSLTATFDRSESERDARAARRVWDSATLHYQFVRGCTSRDTAAFATPNGSLIELDFAARSLRAALRPAVFTAPYSTWSDFLLAPLTEYWREHGCFPLHAGAVELQHERFLVSGFSGSGKTTLCLACLAAGGVWRADDKVLFRASDAGISALSLYRNTNLHPDTVRHHADLSFTLARDPIDETNAKRPCLLEELPVRSDLSEFAPTALLFPGVADRAVTEVVRLPRTEAVVRLAGQSPLSRHPARVAAQVRALAALVRRVPSFEVRSGRDVLAAPGAAAEILLAAVRSAAP